MNYSNGHYQGPNRFATYGTDILEEWVTFDYWKYEIDLSTIKIVNPPATDFLVSFSWSSDYFLYLYNTVGRDYKWWYMNYKSHNELKEFLSGNKSFISLLYDGEPAGFCIINFDTNNIEYFGLLPAFIGKKQGKKFLLDCLNHARLKTNKLWLYTTSFDHPAARPTYQSVGFNLIESKEVSEYYPSFIFKL